MAHPADSKAPAAFAGGRLSPEEAERLSSSFRPCWDLDEAPFSGVGSLSDSELRALQGGGTLADIRATAQTNAHASNGTHAPAPAARPQPPESSVIIDRSVAAVDASNAEAPVASVAKPGGMTMLGLAPPTTGIASPSPATQRSAPPPAASVPPAPVSRRPQAPDFNVAPPARAKAMSLDLEEAYPKTSQTRLRVGLGVAAVAIVGLIVWAASSGGSDKPATPVAAETKTTEDKIPPPPAATTPPPAITAAATPPAATVASAPPAPSPVSPLSVVPQATATAAPTHVATAPPRAMFGSAPAAHPAPKPKGQTIVHDVPF